MEGHTSHVIAGSCDTRLPCSVWDLRLPAQAWRGARAPLGQHAAPRVGRQPPDARAGAPRRQAVIPAALLKDYIAYARARCQPELSPAAANDLITGYCEMRRLGTSRKARPPGLLARSAGGRRSAGACRQLPRSRQVCMRVRTRTAAAHAAMQGTGGGEGCARAGRARHQQTPACLGVPCAGSRCAQPRIQAAVPWPHARQRSTPRAVRQRHGSSSTTHAPKGIPKPCARQVVSATPRQLESLVRLSEALARMRLSPTVEASDVAEALRLMRVRAPPLSGARRRAATRRLACPAPSAPVMCIVRVCSCRMSSVPAGPPLWSRPGGAGGYGRRAARP